MKKTSTVPGFTLIEILTVIALLSIVALGVSQVNFARQSQKEIVKIESQGIVSVLEEIRDNSLIGRAVDFSSTIVTPDSWEITIDTNNHWSIDIFYNSGTPYILQWNGESPYSIFNLTCSNLDATNTQTTSNIDIEYIWDTAKITQGCSGVNNPKKIVFSYGTYDIYNTISLNLLTGTIELD